MGDKIKNSQIAKGNSKIIKSKNKTEISVNKIRRETVWISFIVGFISSLLASVFYYYFFN